MRVERLKLVEKSFIVLWKAHCHLLNTFLSCVCWSHFIHLLLVAFHAQASTFQHLVSKLAMASTSSVQLQLPKLNGRNFNNWSVQMKVLIKSLRNLVENGYTELANTEEFDALRKKEKNSLVESQKKD